MDTSLIAMVLRALGLASGIESVFGKDAARLAPVLNTLASFAELPAETRAAQEALLAQVNTWVAENRGPTDAELDAFKATRDTLDAQLRAARESLGQPPQSGL